MKNNLHYNTDKGDVNILRPPRLLLAIRRQKHIKLQVWIRLVDLIYNFECDWLIELYDNKLSTNELSDNNLPSELVENKSF